MFHFETLIGNASFLPHMPLPQPNQRFRRKIMRIYLVTLLLILYQVEAQPTSNSNGKWKTLSGDQPLVIARGGFSGNYPENSRQANKGVGMPFSLSDSSVLFCNMQLTKDRKAICLTGLSLENATINAKEVLGENEKPNTYKVNGQEIQAFFAIDYTVKKLLKLGLKQSLLSRSYLFEGLPVSTVEEAATTSPVPFWMNVQYDKFYKEHDLDPLDYIEAAKKKVQFDFISCPEIGFMKELNDEVDKDKTKLIFQLKPKEEVEPTTKKTYGELVKDLKSIKSYASGILVPKEYIWPVDKYLYLMDHTSLVDDAHKQGLEVYAYNFANDYLPVSYNYSYDPSLEYLQFIDNSEFSVDGVLTDFPPTASATISCYAHHNVSAAPKKDKILIITHNGASGVYPGCTDKAYERAVADGADIIDCYVQMSKDGVAFCQDSADISATTTAMTKYMTRSTTIPEILDGNGDPKKGRGIFSFDLTWKEIQGLKPVIANPYAKGQMLRNPAYKNAGKLMSLDEFLQLAKRSTVSGVYIGIENAAYLTSKRGLDIVGTVKKALSKASLDEKQQVMIESDDSSVLLKFKVVSKYKRVLQLAKTIHDAPKNTAKEVKKYADAVSVKRPSILPDLDYFTLNSTNVIKEMHAADIAVYVGVLKNEYMSIMFDFFSDPSYDIAAYVYEGVDGIISEYPATVNKYLRRGCDDQSSSFPIIPAAPGSTIAGIMGPSVNPPEAPPLTIKDIVDPPLPPVAKVSAGESELGGVAPSPGKSSPPSSNAMSREANLGFSLLAMTGLALGIFRGH